MDLEVQLRERAVVPPLEQLPPAGRTDERVGPAERRLPFGVRLWVAASAASRARLPGPQSDVDSVAAIGLIAIVRAQEFSASTGH